MTATTKSLNLPVQGMTCASCVSHVEGALKELPGVSNVVVNLATNKASLSYDPARVTLTDMARAVDDVGYVVPTAGIQGLSIRQEAFMDIGTLVLIGIGIVVVLVVVIVLDLLLAGGAGTMGMMHGTAMMMSNPIGQGILLVLLAILGVLVYAVFFR